MWIRPEEQHFIFVRFGTEQERSGVFLTFSGAPKTIWWKFYVKNIKHFALKFVVVNYYMQILLIKLLLNGK